MADGHSVDKLRIVANRSHCGHTVAVLVERQNTVTKLASAGDIPAEILMSLHSPDEILRKAEEAKAKAAALAKQQGVG